VILADQIKSLDWKVRVAEFAGNTDTAGIKEVFALVPTHIGEEG
jgi:mRNA-degrading endonuclease toxin of MazEF toxin-antitoxin module